MELKEFTELLIDWYVKNTHRQKIKVNVEYVDNVYNRRLELALNDKDKKDVTHNKEFIENVNGTIVMPMDNKDIFYILISNKVLKDNYIFIGTVIHELTHIYDYIDFAKTFCNNNFREIDNHSLSQPFYFWTEFNARRYGYLYLRETILSNVEMNEDEQINHIKIIEYPMHYKNLQADLQKYKESKDERKYIYDIIQFMGRIYVWEKSFPNELKIDNLVPDYLISVYGKKILNLYFTLKSMIDFDTAISMIDELKDNINDLFN